MPVAQSDKVKEFKRKQEMKKEVVEAVEAVEEEKKHYDVNAVARIAAAIIISDKSFILNPPALIIKSKAIVDEINK